MSQELGPPADGGQATSAEDPEEQRSAPRSASDTPNAYADSGAAPAPSFSAVWGAPGTSGTTESSTTAEPSDAPEPATAGPRTIPGTVVDSDTPDTPETATAPEASGAPDDVDDPETSTVAEDSSAPDTPAVAGEPAASAASDSSDAAEPADGTDASGSAADDADSSVPDAGPDTATDAGTATDADAASTAEPAADVASVPAQGGPEDRTARPSAAGTTGAPGTPGAAAASVVPADGEATAVPGSSADEGRPSVAARLEAAAGDLDGPLIGDVEGLRYSWQQIQIGFVDDPREAVVDAAVLVEHTAQSLIGALQQRQRLLRSLWDRNTSLDGLGSPATGSSTGAPASGRLQPTSDIPDTEDLRLLIQRYRTMFNEICRP